MYGALSCSDMSNDDGKPESCPSVAPRMPRYCPLCAPKRLPGLPGPVPGPSLIGGLPGGDPSRPLPTPLLPQPPVDRAIADELSDVDKRIVIAGGTISAKRPQDL